MLLRTGTDILILWVIKSLPNSIVSKVVALGTLVVAQEAYGPTFRTSYEDSANIYSLRTNKHYGIPMSLKLSSITFHFGAPLQIKTPRAPHCCTRALKWGRPTGSLHLLQQNLSFRNINLFRRSLSTITSPKTNTSAVSNMTNYEEILKGKYPAKAHAKRVVEFMHKSNPKATGVLYLEGQKAKLQEDNDENVPFRCVTLPSFPFNAPPFLL